MAQKKGASGQKLKLEVLPTLDARGRMYDVDHGKDDGQILAGNREKKKVCSDIVALVLR